MILESQIKFVVVYLQGIIIPKAILCFSDSFNQYRLKESEKQIIALGVCRQYGSEWQLFNSTF